MKNFEKYEKELNDATKDAYFLWSHISNITDDKASDVISLIRWLYEDYKEPLLTKDEKEYLKSVIKPFRDKVNYIVKSSVYLSICNSAVNHNASILISVGSDYKFDGLERDIYYRLEELGL